MMNDLFGGGGKGVTDALNDCQRISPLYTGGGVNHRRCGGRSEGPGQGRPFFYRRWFVKRREGRIHRRRWRNTPMEKRVLTEGMRGDGEGA